jgi:hypothetical protein
MVGVEASRGGGRRWKPLGRAAALVGRAIRRASAMRGRDPKAGRRRRCFFQAQAPHRCLGA